MKQALGRDNFGESLGVVPAGWLRPDPSRILLQDVSGSEELLECVLIKGKSSRRAGQLLLHVADTPQPGWARIGMSILMQLAVRTKCLRGGRTLILHELALVAYEGTAGLT